MSANSSAALEQRYFKLGTALNRLFDEAPYLSRCSDNKTAANIRPREYAIRYPYMQVNRPGMVSWLVFDLDHSNSLIWEDEGLPAPNLVVRNRKNGHAHLFYAIPPVCTSESARSKPIAYMKAVYEAMAARLGADQSYSGPVAKTPGHSWWDTWEIHSAVYDLGELSDYVDLSVKPFWSTEPNIDEVGHSRHCMLFEQVRYYAYSIVSREREQGSFHSFTCLLDAYAHNKNSFRSRGFAVDLSISQVKSTVKSIARWTWDRYTGNSRCHRGAMGLDPFMALQEKQKLSAKRTHETRRNGTESRIRAAARLLAQKGQKLTRTAIAAAARLSRQTVAKYGSVIEEVATEATGSVVSMATVKTGDVNYGVHQITAPARWLGASRSTGGFGGAVGAEPFGLLGAMGHLASAIGRLLFVLPPD